MQYANMFLFYFYCRSIVFFSDIDDCAGVTCQNNGTCQDGVNMFSCICEPGFEGEFCETGQIRKIHYFTVVFAFFICTCIYEQIYVDLSMNHDAAHVTSQTEMKIASIAYF